MPASPSTRARPGRRSSLGFEDPEDFARARDRLVAAGYTDTAMLEAVGVPAASLPRQGGTSLALGMAPPGSPLETLILLFLLAVPVAEAAARQALAPMTLDAWAAAGLLEVRGGRARPRTRLIPFRGLFLAHDLPDRKSRPDYVMGVGTSTLRLMDVAIRRPIRAMLDLGCGCGTQGIVSARHGAKAVSTDRNPRAVRFALFNARLNGQGDLEALQGDLFAPVAGRTFDLVLSNPPFVISPDARYIYRDGGLPGDGFCRLLVHEVPAVLSENGFCQILCNWAHRRGEDWRESLLRWFDGTGCDVWAMRLETEEAALYADTWIRQTEPDDPVRRSAIFRRWVEHYRREGIEGVSSGVVTMRKSTGRANWVRVDEDPPRILGPCGDDIEMGFALRDVLETLRDDEALLELRPRVSPVVQMHQRLAPGDGAWRSEEMELRREQGLGSVARIDPPVAGLVSRCDGRRTLRQLLEEMAAAYGQDLGAVAGPMLAIARGLIERAFLVPEGFFG